MKTIRCPQCNLADWENVVVCKRCKYDFQAAVPSEVAEESLESSFQREGSEFERQEMFEEPEPTEYQRQEVYSPEDNYGQNYEPNNQTYEQTNYQPRYAYSAPTSKPKIKMAVTSMILGIIGMPFVSMFWGLFLIVVLAMILGTSGAIIGGVIVLLFIPSGLILGIVSLLKSKRNPVEYGGKGFAIAGIVCSSLGLLTLPLVAAIAIPNILAARKAANEGSAIASVRTLSEAEKILGQTQGGHCSDLTELKNANMIDDVLASGQKTGYQFMILKLPVAGGGCEITATPISNFDGNRSFYYSTTDNIIRVANKNGMPADRNDEPLESNFEQQPPKIASSDEMKQ